jgi:lipase maturation factor 1
VNWGVSGTVQLGTTPADTMDLPVLKVATPRLFLRFMGAFYTIAFLSFGVQALGLVGSHGILPIADFLRAIRAGAGTRAIYELPTLLWLNSSDAAISALWIIGSILGLVAAAGFWQRTALAACLVLWLSVCAAGQEFLYFQWDYLLAEAGFLSIFADQSPVRVWLFRWLVFRLIFLSGVVKLASGDPTWHSFTALQYHYETQPLPTPLAWLMHQLPGFLQRASTAFVLFAELIVPFLFFGPRRIRVVGAAITVALQVLILLTGNYTIFNWLTIALCLWLVIEPDRTTGRLLPHRAVSAMLAGFIALVSALLFLEVFNGPMPPGGGAILHAIAPLRLVNTYGLFAVMTTTRNEIIVEGSADGENWRAYEFHYKPGDPLRMPPVVAPHQPRLDWQMWFAALGTYQQNRWFVNFMLRLLQGEPRVLGLLRYNPFPNAPPRYVRARIFQYHFTRFGERGWWRREERGVYLPAVGLKQ